MKFSTEIEALAFAKKYLVEVAGVYVFDVNFAKALLGKKSKVKIEVDKEGVDKLVDDILALDIPNHKVGSSSVSFKPNRADLRDHLERFMSKYQYEISVVYEAIKAYIDEVNNEGTMYKKALKYFIHKQGEGSGLADYCDKVLTGEMVEHTFNNVL
jgi:hypothetical protein